MIPRTALNTKAIQPKSTNMSKVPMPACHGVKTMIAIVLRMFATKVAPTNAVPMI